MVTKHKVAKKDTKLVVTMLKQEYLKVNVNP
jgi:hypothetical protein